MKKYSLLPIIIIILSGCFLVKIERLESRKLDDGSASLKKKDSTYIKTFDLEKVGLRKKINAENEIYFEVITTENLNEIISRNKMTLVTIWASWCPVCHNQLSIYNRIVDSLQQIGIEAILVAQNFNISYSQKILFKNSIFFQSYILSDNRVGTDETKKQYILLRNYDAKVHNNGGSVPSSILFDQSGKIIKIKAGLINALDFYLKKT